MYSSRKDKVNDIPVLQTGIVLVIKSSLHSYWHVHLWLELPFFKLRIFINAFVNTCQILVFTCEYFNPVYTSPTDSGILPSSLASSPRKLISYSCVSPFLTPYFSIHSSSLILSLYIILAIFSILSISFTHLFCHFISPLSPTLSRVCFVELMEYWSAQWRLALPLLRNR